MYILTRYIFRQISLTFLMVSAVIIGVLWVVQSLKFVELAINSHASLRVFLKFSLLLLPDLLTIIFPIAGFIGALFVLHRIALDREMIIMKMAGQSEWKIARPILGFGILLTLTLYGINIFILPKSFEKLRDLELVLKNSLPAVLVQEGVFNTIKDTTIYVRQKENQNRLKGVFAYVTNRDRSEAYALMAQEGQLIKTPEGPRVLMLKGNRQQLTSGYHSLSLLYFDKTMISLNQPSRSGTRPKKPHELPLMDLLFPDRATHTRSERQRLRSEGYQRLLNPLLAIAYIVIATAFLLRVGFKRQNQTWAILWAGGSVLSLQGFILMLMNLSAQFKSAALCGILLIFLVISMGCYSLYNPFFEGIFNRMKRAIGQNI